ncbi:hypothetical protein IQ255_27755, partial [Pleurocapsales cyanobacterium LEGE 10410]|nr:hypothetical protein [Pleurocapsales cyanobacterium LEGE 10410]
MQQIVLVFPARLLHYFKLDAPVDWVSANVTQQQITNKSMKPELFYTIWFSQRTGSTP